MQESFIYHEACQLLCFLLTNFLLWVPCLTVGQIAKLVPRDFCDVRHQEMDVQRLWQEELQEGYFKIKPAINAYWPHTE